MRGIYQIRNTVNGKRYVGKSNNIARRLIDHRCALNAPARNKNTNRYLYNAVRKYGIGAFAFEVIEVLRDSSEGGLADRELFWMDEYSTCERPHGYNLRRDSSTSTSVADETCDLLRGKVGDKNPNYGNRWTTDMKVAMSNKIKDQHADGRYGDEWKEKISLAVARLRSNWSLAERVEHGHRTSLGRQAGFDFGQYDYEGDLIRSWGSVEEIVANNPTYKWQNIYAACNGNKPTAYGFMWRRAIAGKVENKIDKLMRKPMGRKRKNETQ